MMPARDIQLKIQDEPASADKAADIKQAPPDNDEQTVSQVINIVESSDEGDEFFIGNGADETVDEISENNTKCALPTKVTTVETQTDPIFDSIEPTTVKLRNPLDEIKPYLKPGENSKEMLPSEVFMMVKKRIFSTKYKRTKLG